jgi:hypothetical protein
MVAFIVMFTMRPTVSHLQRLIGLTMRHVRFVSRMRMLNCLGVAISHWRVYALGRELMVSCAPERKLSELPSGCVISAAIDNKDRSTAYKLFRPVNLGGGNSGWHITVCLLYAYPAVQSPFAVATAVREALRQLETLSDDSCLALQGLSDRLLACPVLIPMELSEEEARAFAALTVGKHGADDRAMAKAVLQRTTALIDQTFVTPQLPPADQWLVQSGALAEFRHAMFGFSKHWAGSLHAGKRPMPLKVFLPTVMEMPPLPAETVEVALPPILQPPSSAEVVCEALDLVQEYVSRGREAGVEHVVVSADQAVMRNIQAVERDPEAHFDNVTSHAGVLHVQMNASELILRRWMPAGLPEIMAKAGYSRDQIDKLDRMDYDRRNALVVAFVLGSWLTITILATAVTITGISLRSKRLMLFVELTYPAV